jgi:hypothetical protein
MSGMNPTPYKAIEGVYEEVESLLSREGRGRPLIVILP